MNKRVVFSAAMGLLLFLAALFALTVGGQTVAAAPLHAQSALTVSEITSDGITDTLAAANADGNRFSNDGKTFLEVANGSGGTITVTVETPITFLGLAVADKTVAIPDGETYFIGPFRPSLYNQLTGSYKGFVYVEYSSATTVTVAAWRLD
jgi:hypothetical protein